MDQNTLALLNRMYATIDAITEIEDRDDSMMIEMSQAMLNDIINDGALKPVVDYLKHYVDFMEQDEIENLAQDI